MSVYETNPRLLRRSSLTKAFDINYSITSSSSSEDHSKSIAVIRPPCNCRRKDHHVVTTPSEEAEFATLPVDEKRKKFNYKRDELTLKSNTSPTESFCSCRSSTCNYCTCDSATLTPSSPADGLDNSNTSSNALDDGADDEATEVEGNDSEEEEEEEEEKVLSKSTKL
ncbi:hypothetical protein ACFFRR_003461 [Megaselia abdita]